MEWPGSRASQGQLALYASLGLLGVLIRPLPARRMEHYTTLRLLHYTTLHYTTLHYDYYTTLHYTTLLHTTLHYSTLLYTTLQLVPRTLPNPPRSLSAVYEEGSLQPCLFLRSSSVRTQGGLSAAQTWHDVRPVLYCVYVQIGILHGRARKGASCLRNDGDPPWLYCMCIDERADYGVYLFIYLLYIYIYMLYCLLQ